MLGVFADVAAAGAAITTLLRDGLRPRVLELADRHSIDHIRAKSRYRFPANAGAIVLHRGRRRARRRWRCMMEKIGLRCDELGALDVLGATEPAERRARVGGAPPDLARAQGGATGSRSTRTSACRAARSSRCSRASTSVSAETGIATAVFGHAGDGNLHVNLLSNDDPDDPAVRARMWAAAAQVFAHTIALGGTLSGEHGIGLTKRDYMHLEQSEQLLEWQRTLEGDVGSVGPAQPRQEAPGARTKPCSE